MSEKTEFIRDKKFIIDLINSIDENIKKRFEILNNTEGISSYSFDDGNMELRTFYNSDIIILDTITKLEIIRQKYSNELNILKGKKQ